MSHLAWLKLGVSGRKARFAAGNLGKCWSKFCYEVKVSKRTRFHTFSFLCRCRRRSSINTISEVKESQRVPITLLTLVQPYSSHSLVVSCMVEIAVFVGIPGIRTNSTLRKGRETMKPEESQSDYSSTFICTYERMSTCLPSPYFYYIVFVMKIESQNFSIC